MPNENSAKMNKYVYQIDPKHIVKFVPTDPLRHSPLHEAIRLNAFCCKYLPVGLT